MKKMQRLLINAIILLAAVWGTSCTQPGDPTEDGAGPNPFYSVWNRTAEVMEVTGPNSLMPDKVRVGIKGTNTFDVYNKQGKITAESNGAGSIPAEITNNGTSSYTVEITDHSKVLTVQAFFPGLDGKGYWGPVMEDSVFAGCTNAHGTEPDKFVSYKMMAAADKNWTQSPDCKFLFISASSVSLDHSTYGGNVENVTGNYLEMPWDASGDDHFWTLTVDGEVLDLNIYAQRTFVSIPTEATDDVATNMTDKCFENTKVVDCPSNLVIGYRDIDYIVDATVYVHKSATPYSVSGSFTRDDNTIENFEKTVDKFFGLVEAQSIADANIPADENLAAIDPDAAKRGKYFYIKEPASSKLFAYFSTDYDLAKHAYNSVVEQINKPIADWYNMDAGYTNDNPWLEFYYRTVGLMTQYNAVVFSDSTKVMFKVERAQ